MCLTIIVFGIVTVDMLVNYWPMFFPISSSSPRSLLKSSSISFPFVSKVVNEGNVFFSTCSFMFAPSWLALFLELYLLLL